MRGLLAWVGLLLIALLAGGVVMVLELAAPRLAAPFVGTTALTWTVVIGTFLLGLAAGNALGGRWADRERAATLPLLLLLCAGAAWLTPHLHDAVTAWMRGWAHGLRVAIGIPVAFLPLALLLGTVTPVVARDPSRHGPGRASGPPSRGRGGGRRRGQRRGDLPRRLRAGAGDGHARAVHRRRRPPRCRGRRRPPARAAGRREWPGAARARGDAAARRLDGDGRGGRRRDPRRRDRGRPHGERSPGQLALHVDVGHRGRAHGADDRRLGRWDARRPVRRTPAPAGSCSSWLPSR